MNPPFISGKRVSEADPLSSNPTFLYLHIHNPSVAMSISQNPTAISFPLEKKESVTDDLHLSGSTAAPESENNASKRDLYKIDEGQETSNKKAGVVGNASLTPTATSSDKASDRSVNPKSPKTLAEITQDLKHDLSKIVEEINNSDAEFERVIGNLEKQISQLRLKLGNSPLEK